ERRGDLRPPRRQQRRRPVPVGAPARIRDASPCGARLRRRYPDAPRRADQALRLHIRQVRRRPQRDGGSGRVPVGGEEDITGDRRGIGFEPYSDGFGGDRRPQLPCQSCQARGLQSG
ncbi:hypothetical protein LINGRAHAP2_LOCUS13379, partial [Linum grandiflorum]